MNAGALAGIRSGTNWWIRRNPSYLLSAACMAVGARLLLVEPGSRAGDIGLILLTLGVLQVPDPVDASNELWLYLAWWVLAAIAMSAVGAVRGHVPGRFLSAESARAWDSWGQTASAKRKRG